MPPGLSGDGIHDVLATTGEKHGAAIGPHVLGDAAITAALDETNGNVREVRNFSGHAGIEVVVKYEDNRRDRDGEVASKVAKGDLSNRKCVVDGQGPDLAYNLLYHIYLSPDRRIVTRKLREHPNRNRFAHQNPGHIQLADRSRQQPVLGVGEWLQNTGGVVVPVGAAMAR